MNVQYNFTETGGFPLDQNVLKDIQDGLLLTESSLATLLGPLVIISGCAVAGGVAASGVVAINGQILPFVGGAVQTKVIIVETDSDLTYFDGGIFPANITRIATFGDDGVQDNLWGSFVSATIEGVLEDIDSLNTDVATLGAEITAIDTELTTKLTKLASGTAVLGNADPNQSNIGEGGTVTIPFGVTLPDTNYMILLTVISLSSDPQNDLYHQITVRAKTTTSFTVYFREAATFVQNVNLDWIAVSF